ncbi:MAG: HD domain-containing protein [Oscillospiraceae bacterium]|nr:HD domain-containing protein [Oscillospiraceae bacterium]
MKIIVKNKKGYDTGMQKYKPKTVYDSIWGDIQLTNCEYKLINTPIFLRLKNIKQMSLAYIGHAGAQHTRYEHSLGCLYVADYLAKTIAVYDEESKTALEACDFSINEGRISGSAYIDVIKHVRIAALLHDIGHAPMSHLFEEVSKKYPEYFEYIPDVSVHEENLSKYFTKFNPFKKYGHEKYTIYQIYANEDLTSILADYAINKDWLTYLIDGHTNVDIPPYLDMFKALISGDFDADRIDYINRDFNRCGINSVIDLSRYALALNYCAFPINDSTNQNSNKFIFKTIVNTNYIMEISNLLFQRYMLTRRVHQNKSTRLHEQLLISKIAYHLEILKEEGWFKCIEWIHKAHTVMRDSDLIEQMKTSEIEPITPLNNELVLNRIVDGVMNTRYSTNIMMVQTLSPTARFPAHYLFKHKNLTREFEESLTKKLLEKGAIDENSQVICDFMLNKPSKMEITAIGSTGKNDERGILDSNTSSLPHALYEAGIVSLQISIYTESEIDYEYSTKQKTQEHQIIPIDEAKNEITRMIGDINEEKLTKLIDDKDIFNITQDLEQIIEKLNIKKSNEASKSKTHTEEENREYRLRQDITHAIEDVYYKSINEKAEKSIYPLELIILLIYKHLIFYVREVLKTNVDVKIKGDGQFHNFVKFILSELMNYEITFFPTINLSYNKFSDEILRVCESLTHYGCLDRVYKSIRFRNVNNIFSYSARADRTINRWGFDFIDKTLYRVNNDIIQSLSEIIKNLVYAKQNEFYKEHRIVMTLNIGKEIGTDLVQRLRSKVEWIIRRGNGCIYKYTHRAFIISK